MTPGRIPALLSNTLQVYFFTQKVSSHLRGIRGEDGGEEKQKDRHGAGLFSGQVWGLILSGLADLLPSLCWPRLGGQLRDR